MRNSFSDTPPTFKPKQSHLSNAETLPLRKKPTEPIGPEEASVSFHPLDKGFIVSVRPPSVPSPDSPSYQNHACIDLVLVIDVSGSMQDSAPMPSVGGAKEHTGLSILDLTKHAARTIVETLNKGDRLGIVTFGFDAKVDLARAVPNFCCFVPR